MLDNIGISSDFVQKVRFRGPVGKLALMGIVCVLGIGGVGLRSSSELVQMVCVCLATLTTLSLAAAVLWYSTKFPDQATLEGLELVVMHRQKAWAAKGWNDPGGTSIVPSPSNAPPQPNPPIGDDV
jgi:hypothetical protein